MLAWKQKKQKHTRNISGLRNQSTASPAPTDSSYNPTQLRSLALSSEYNGDESEIEEKEDLELLIHFDSLKMNLQYQQEYENLDENDENEEYIEDWEGFNSQEMGNAIDAYWCGLVGWAAKCIVRKQKGHWSVSKKAMKALEALKASSINSDYQIHITGPQLYISKTQIFLDAT